MPGLSYLQLLRCPIRAANRRPTMRLNDFRSLVALAVLALSLALAACESDGPVFVDGETTSLIDDNLALGQTSNTHVRALAQGGTVSVEATDFTARSDETGEVLEGYLLGVSVGVPDPEDDTRCQITFTKTLAVGQSFSVYSREGAFCVVTFRPPDQNPAAAIRYLLTLSGAFS